MGKMRSGSIRERPSTFFARVMFLDEDGERQKIERQADTQKQAGAYLKEIVQGLSTRKGIKITSQKTHERRGGIFARVTFVDEKGERREIERRAKNRSDAKEIIKEVLRDLDDHGETLIDATNLTFAELADHYEKNYLIEPEYIDGRKVAGLRSAYDLGLLLKVLREYFGKSKVRLITYGDLKRFKAERLKTKTKRGGQRSITTMNRELQLLRRLLNVAYSNGWIKRNPFSMGDALITPGDEKKRERILTRDEEERLLAACTDKRAHLKAIIICALDTGMRRGEMLKLVLSDMDFDNHIITVRAFNTKTMRERTVAMTERLASELLAIVEKLPVGVDVPLFGITCDFKNAFIAARKAAGLNDVRFHDLRHTHATRLVSAHMPLSEVGRALGHTQANTTYRYVNANVETARRVAALLDEFNADRESPESRTAIN
jgi:integrase